MANYLTPHEGTALASLAVLVLGHQNRATSHDDETSASRIRFLAHQQKRFRASCRWFTRLKIGGSQTAGFKGVANRKFSKTASARRKSAQTGI